MLIERHPDAAAYAALVTPLLLRDEARYNLELAIVGRLAAGAPVGDEPPVLLTVDGAPALMTPPFNLAVAAVPPQAAPALADYAVAEGIAPPGVLGAPGTARAFAERYAALTGRTYAVAREQGVYALTELVPPRPAPGALRTADERDDDLVVGWSRAFQQEVGLPDHGTADRMRERVRDGLIWLWEDGGEVVSLAGCGGFTPNGARVGPVYTPPALRGRGYASAVTAGATEALLARGLTSTFLYTDLANPTSNKIYQAIGYRHVADVIEVTFAG
jgi:ribosomal protein S18 acetylase RimI-like enzyme